jgi:ADP-ribose pyrophosphatase YjhB (NUDIX family)
VIDRELLGRERRRTVHAAKTVSLEDAFAFRLAAVRTFRHDSAYTLIQRLDPCPFTVRTELSNRSVNPDPRLEALRRLLSARPPAVIDRAPDHREAAVALVIRPEAEIELLFIQRAERESDPWSGHIAFPGGRRANDEELLHTSMRETHEETGIALSRTGDVLGALDEVEPATRRLPAIIITPFVIAAPAGTMAIPDGTEVRTTAWVPIRALRDPSAISEFSIARGSDALTFPSLVFHDYVIWGLTHRILIQFLEIAAEAGV